MCSAPRIEIFIAYARPIRRRDITALRRREKEVERVDAWRDDVRALHTHTGCAAPG